MAAIFRQFTCNQGQETTSPSSRIGRLIRGVRIGRKIRLSRQHEGHDLDIDAVLDAGIALRTGREPDPRIFRSSTSVHRDLSVGWRE